MRIHLAVEFGPQVCVSVKLDNGQPGQIALDQRVSLGSTHEGGQNSVLTPQGKRKDRPVVIGLNMIHHFVKLAAKGRSGPFPDGECSKAPPIWKLGTECGVKQLDLPTGFNASSRAVHRSGPVRGGQFVSERNHDHVRTALGLRQAEELAILKRR
jgi:hypothetical protein